MIQGKCVFNTLLNYASELVVLIYCSAYTKINHEKYSNTKLPYLRSAIDLPYSGSTVFSCPSTHSVGYGSFLGFSQSTSAHTVNHPSCKLYKTDVKPRTSTDRICLSVESYAHPFPTYLSHLYYLKMIVSARYRIPNGGRRLRLLSGQCVREGVLEGVRRFSWVINKELVIIFDAWMNLKLVGQ